MKVPVKLFGFAMTVVFMLATRAAGATVYAFTPASVGTMQATLGTLQAGDEVTFAAGTYVLSGMTFITAAGTPIAPVNVHALPGAAVVFERDDASNDGILIQNSTYVTFSGIELFATTNAPNARAIRILASSNVTIADCDIHDFVSGISANTNADDLSGIVIRHNHLHHLTAGTDEGVYLGCLAAGCTVHDSIVEQNWIHDTGGATGGSMGAGILIKRGSSAIVRDNVVSSNAACVLAYGGGPTPNVIERNGCIDVAADVGIQVSADAIVRNNIVINPASYGIAASPGDGLTVSNLTFVNNTVVSSNGGLRITTLTGAAAIYDNAIYASTAAAVNLSGTLTGVTASNNVGIGTVTGLASGFSATGNLANDFVSVAYDGSSLDTYPKTGSILIGAGEATQLAVDDYNGSLRGSQHDVGAYMYSATGNPSATISAGFKPAMIVSSGDAGVDGGSDDAGSDASTDASIGSGEDASPGRDSGVFQNDGGDSASDTPADDSGCGCGVEGRDSNGFGLAVGWLIVLGAIVRRRRR